MFPAVIASWKWPTTFRPARATAPIGLWGLSWRVPDAQPARTRLQAAGLDGSEVRRTIRCVQSAISTQRRKPIRS